MTTKYDKAHTDRVNNLGDELDGRREAENQAAAADKAIREMVTQYHTKVLGELDKIVKVLEIVRCTPVEIVATQEVRHPLQPFDGASIQGQRSLTFCVAVVSKPRSTTPRATTPTSNSDV